MRQSNAKQPAVSSSTQPRLRPTNVGWFQVWNSVLASNALKSLLVLQIEACRDSSITDEDHLAGIQELVAFDNSRLAALVEHARTIHTDERKLS